MPRHGQLRLALLVVVVRCGAVRHHKSGRRTPPFSLLGLRGPCAAVAATPVPVTDEQGRGRLGVPHMCAWECCATAVLLLLRCCAAGRSPDCAAACEGTWVWGCTLHGMGCGDLAPPTSCRLPAATQDPPQLNEIKSTQIKTPLNPVW